VNSPTSGADRSNLSQLLREYLFAVSKHWFAVIVGVALGWLDLVERIFGTWWVIRPWVRLATAALGLATAQFLAYRDLHQAHLQRVADQQKEIDALKVKPYDRAKAELVGEKVRGLDAHQLELLRFLLQHGATERGEIFRLLLWPENVFNGALQNLRQRMLIVYEERLNVGRAGANIFWLANPAFEQVLRDKMFG
jgi:hypothetical protein